jgi:WD40 repeat protein
MKKILLFWVLLPLWLTAAPVILPTGTIEVNGTVKDMVYRDNTLVIGTDAGSMQVYDLDKGRFVMEVKLPDVKDFMGDPIPARVFSVDRIATRYLLLSDSGQSGYSDLWLYEEGRLQQLITAERKMALIKVRFIDKDHILLGYLSNEAALYDIKSGKERYRVQLSESKFSDFALNEDRSQAVFACESGVLHVIDTHSGKILHELKGQNVDNVYKVDFKQHIVAAAGQDRRAALYDLDTGKGEYIQADFMIYATALSPSAQRVAFAMDEANDITVYARQNKEIIAILKGQKSTLNTIIFKDEKRLFSASDDSTVMIWDIK